MTMLLAKNRTRNVPRVVMRFDCIAALIPVEGSATASSNRSLSKKRRARLLLVRTVERSGNLYCSIHYSLVKEAGAPTGPNLGFVIALALTATESSFHSPAIRAVLRICGAGLLTSAFQVIPTCSSSHCPLLRFLY